VTYIPRCAVGGTIGEIFLLRWKVNLIAAQGIIVEAFNTRKGHRAAAARLTEAGVEKKLTSKGVEGLRAQMATWDGLSGDSGMWFNPVFVG
jgi:hypothetical protein